MVPSGATITYVGTWRTSLFKTADGIISQVSRDLSAAQLNVRSQSNDASFLANLPGFLKESFNVTLHIEVDSDLGYGSVDDIVSIVRSNVYKETGFFPESDSVPYVQMPGQSGPTPTGETDPNAGRTQGCIAGTSNDTSGSFSISCWFGNLTTKGLSTVGIFAVLAVLAIGLIVFAAPALAAKGARKAAGAAEGAAAA